MHPGEINGISVGFPTQPGWLNPEMRMQQLARQLIILGSLQIVFGALCVVLAAGSLGIMLTTYLDSLAFVGYGFWIGALFIVTGPFGIMGGKRRSRCYINSFNVLSIVSASISALLISLAITSAVMYGYSYYYYSDSAEQNAGIAIESLMAVTAVAEAIVAIYSSVVCCKMGNCCGECGGDDCCCPPSSYPNQAFVVNQQVVGQFPLGQMQQPPTYNGYNQPQPVVLANQQQPMTYTLPNGQQLVIFQNAPQPMGDTSSDQANLTKY